MTAKKRKKVNLAGIAPELAELTMLRNKPPGMRHTTFVYELMLIARYAAKNNLSPSEKEKLKSTARIDYNKALVSKQEHLLSKRMERVNPDICSNIYHEYEMRCDKAMELLDKSLNENKANKEEFDILRGKDFWKTYHSEFDRRLYGSKVSASSQGSPDAIAPMDIKGMWKSKSFNSLRYIDSDPKREGIQGDKQKLKQLKYYLARRRHRKDIADTLYFDNENNRIKTTMPHRSMFREK